MSLYPNEEEITMFGEKIKYPGLKDGKFTNGSFSDPKQLASFIPAETLNLILDNLGEAIKSVGLEPNNTNINQLAQALNLRTNYKVSQELMEDLIVLDTNNEFKHLEINESGYIYSQDIDLKQKLADKLKRNKDDIKIINWYILRQTGVEEILFSNKPEEPKGDFEDIALYYYNNNSSVEDSYNATVLLQIADELTPDIAQRSFAETINLRVIQEKYKATCLMLNIAKDKGFAPVYAHASSNLFGAASITSGYGFTDTRKVINIEKSGYFYTNISIDKTSSEVKAYVSNLYNSSNILFFGDKVKIRIALLNAEYMECKFNKTYNVSVRYAIINK
ncbi:hypothetical protein EPJ66_07875 [Brachyspira aalborgi]|nr:hypothetical protein [Brachyspira aalborgi]TXJ51542.1 hypothetical protein EPJ66_07875 [Brachyspira aalborgi]